MEFGTGVGLSSFLAVLRAHGVVWYMAGRQ